MVYMPEGDKPIIIKPIKEEVPTVEDKTVTKKKGRPSKA